MKEIFDNIRHKNYTIQKNISDDCKDLIDKLLEIDKDKRIKVDEIFEHPWVTKKINEFFPNWNPNENYLNENNDKNNNENNNEKIVDKKKNVIEKIFNDDDESEEEKKKFENKDEKKLIINKNNKLKNSDSNNENNNNIENINKENIPIFD
jgi:serine/threonine protein kinase